jgi:hypothetical protein
MGCSFLHTPAKAAPLSCLPLQNQEAWWKNISPFPQAPSMLIGDGSSTMIVLSGAQVQAEPEKTFTINNCLITKVYFRRRYKHKKIVTEERAPSQEPAFRLVQEEFSPSRRGQAGSGKRKPTLAVVTNLRMSKRQAAKNDGFKPASPAVTRSRKKSRKSPAPAAPSSGKRLLFSIPYSEFLDLGVIDKCVTEQLTHPHISIPVLQKVAQELCSIPLRRSQLRSC